MKLKAISFWLSLGVVINTWAIEHSLKGVVELRAQSSDSVNSFLDGGYGKFRFHDGDSVSLSQLGLHHRVEWSDTTSSHVIANAYIDDVNSAVGLTEAYIKYAGLPSEAGLKISLRGGIFYPQLSVENNATAWSSPNFLSYSTINSWVGEELRHIGLEANIDLLGKFRQSNHDVSFNVSLFKNNDTTGAMLSWHGWTMSSRQTLWHERIPIAEFPARISGDLTEQASESDPFIELDNELGTLTNVKWKVKGNGEVLAGYYDNHADTRVVINGQYAWLTRFYHAGLKWGLWDGAYVLGQFMQGNSRMNAPTGRTVVAIDFQSSYLAIIQRFKQHNVAIRLEEFYTRDRDDMVGDNNDEYGKALTLNYRYRLSKHWFFHTEYNWINSSRPSRYYVHDPRQLIERQWQVAAKYYF